MCLYQMAANNIKQWFNLGLFGRTFTLLTGLMLVSLIVWLQVFYKTEHAPRTKLLVERVYNITSISQSALNNATGASLNDLHKELSNKENLKVVSLKPNDVITPLPKDSYWLDLAAEIKNKLGSDTIVAWEINHKPGIWVSFNSNHGQYWLVFERDQLNINFKIDWVGWIASALIVALIGAAISVGFVNQPLAQLAYVARQLATGQNPSPLPEKGPIEVRDMNTAFNRMVTDIRQTETDREIMLAGLSHDLRTPLSRMRLEIEMSPISDEARQAIDEDLAQINRSIEQLMEYARPAYEAPKEGVNISNIMHEVFERERIHTQNQNGQINANIQENLFASINPHDVKRIVINLIENARRYGRSTVDNRAYITLKVWQKHNKINIEVSDLGSGINPDDINRLLRPFSRGDTARTGVGGAGLGLAIVERLLRQVGGALTLKANSPHGLVAKISLPKLNNNRGYKSDSL